MYEEVEYTVEDPIATITFNRPDRLNAITGRMLREMRHAFAAAEEDERVVAIILTGAGRGFCAGADMSGLQATSQGEGRAFSSDDPQLDAEPGAAEMGDDFKVSYAWMLAVRKPVIAVINGPCAGLGFCLAALCDLRFASDRAVFTTAFANLGLIAEHVSSWILPRLLGPSRALDLLWTGRKIDAAEAQSLGLVNRVVPHDDLMAEVHAYLEQLTTRSAPTSLMIMKQQVYKHLMTDLGDACRESDRLMAESLTRDDFKEGVAAYLEKRPPKFTRVGAVKA